MRMIELVVGDKAEIISVEAKGEICSRLVDMGLVKGTRFKLLRKAPLGDPLEIMVKGFLLTLRLNEAKNIYVNKIGQLGDGKPMNCTTNNAQGSKVHNIFNKFRNRLRRRRGRNEK